MVQNHLRENSTIWMDECHSSISLLAECKCSSANTRGIFCDGTCQDAILEDLFLNDASLNSILEPFLHGIDFRRLGVSCCPTALLSKYPPLSSQILCHHMHSGTYFFRKIALANTLEPAVIVTTMHVDIKIVSYFRYRFY
jgi:hypothetical protein